MGDAINPDHYKTPGGLEAIDVLEAFFPDNPHLWTATKYLLRCGKKDDPSQEIGKTIWYLQRFLKVLESQQDGKTTPPMVRFIGPSLLDHDGMIAPRHGSVYDVLSVEGEGDGFGLDTGGTHLWYTPSKWVEAVDKL